MEQNQHLSYKKLTQNMSFHLHETLEIIRVLEGTGSISIDLNHFSLKKEDIIVIQWKTLHAIYSDKMVYESFQIPIESYLTNKESINKYLQPIINNELFVVSRMEPSEEFNHVLNQIKENLIQKAPYYELRLASTIFNLIHIMYTHDYLNVKQVYQVDTKQNETIRNVLYELNQNYMTKLKMEEIAYKVGYSQFYLSKLFKDVTNKTMMEYVIDLRLDHARNLLVNTNQSVTEITYAIGMSDVSYFIRMFKRKYEMTPNQFKKYMKRLKDQ